MLGLIAAQLKYKVETKALQSGKAVWVDVSYPRLYVDIRGFAFANGIRWAVALGEH